MAFGLTTQVGSGETLRQLAGRFGLTRPADLAGLVRALDDVAGLLAPGATLQVARQGTYVITAADTLASVATAFGTTPQAITAANPGVDCQPGHPCWYPAPDVSVPRPGMNIAVPVGLAVTLPPGLTHTVRAGDTLAGVARRFGLTAVELILGATGDAAGNANLDNAGLLVPQTTIPLPDLRYAVDPSDTPLRIAQRFGLTVEELVLANRDVGFDTVVVPDAEVLPLGVLVDVLAGSGAFNTPAGALARFLLHGLRLPSPDEITADPPVDRAALRLYPLAALTGQQVVPPSPLPADYAITLSAGADAPAVTFPGGADSVTVPLSAADRDMLARIGTQLAHQPPIDDTPLAVTPYPAVVVAPRQYALGKPIPWQVADPPRLVHDTGEATPAAVPTAGAPALYPFPDALRLQVESSAGRWVDQVAAAVADVPGLLVEGFRLALDAGTHVVTADDTVASVARGLGLSVAVLADAVADLPGLVAPGVPFALPDATTRATRAGDTLRGLGADGGPALLVDLVTGVQAGPTAPADQRPLSGFGWATRIDFGVRRAPDPARPGQFLATVFEVFGTDPAAVHDLERLLGHLDGAGAADAVTLALLYPASGGAGAGPALRSDPVDPAEVLLVKANLATRSRPPVTAAAVTAVTAAPDAPLVAATTAPDDARGFLTLLWEAAVTNTGGYHLWYRVAATGGGGLPPEVFNQDPTATVSLLVTVRPTAGAPSTIGLRPFHNTAVVVESVADPTAAVLATPRRHLTSGPASLSDVARALGAAAGTPDGLSVQMLGAANAETRNLLAPNATVTVGAAAHRVAPGDTIGGVAQALRVGVAAVVDAVAADTAVLNPGAALDVYPGWLTHRGTLRAGAAGFRIVRADPDPGANDPVVNDPAAAGPGQDDPRTKLSVLFNLVGYRLTGDPASGFAASADGLPVGPAQPTTGPLNHALTAVADQDPWTYQKQIRVDRFARAGAVRLGDLQDPYAGVGTTARFGWQYQDVFGNRLLPQRTVDVDVRYTDELIAVSQWPAVLADYRFTGPPGPAALVVTLALDTSAYVPTPGDLVAPLGTAGGPAGVTARAGAHRDRYAEVFWQVAHDVTAEVTTTVDGAVPHAVPVDAFSAFAAAAWGYLRTVAELTPVAVTTRDGDTLAAIADAYRVPVAELVAANRSVAQNADAANLLAPPPGTVRTAVVEARYRVIQNDTLGHIAAQAPPFARTDEGQLAARNADLALQAGRLVVAGDVHVVAPADTLAGLAAVNGLDPARLGAANAQRAGLLAPGTVLTLRAATYQVGDGDTFAGIATRTTATVAEVAAAAGGSALVAGSVVVVPVAVTVAAGATPAALAGRFAVTVAELLEANATADVLTPGAVIALPDGAPVSIGAGDTLASIAAAHDVGVADLAGPNADAPALLRPGTRLTSAYRVQAGDTFRSVADRFGVSPAALGTANAQVAGLVAAEESVLFGSRRAPVAAGDTFASLAAAAGVPLAELAAANATTAGLLTAGVPVALPRHVRVAGPGDHTHTVAAGDTLAGIAVAHGVDVTLLGAANTDVDGILAPAVTLSYTAPDGRSYQAVTGANDTLSTVALRLQALLAADGTKQQVTAAQVAEANPSAACLAAGGLLLVPPATATFTWPVTEANPLALFPLETTLVLRRTANVDPALAANPAVTSVATPLAPFLPDGTGGRAAALRAFADAFEAAFTAPPLKLAATGNTADAGTPRFVAVQYGPGAVVDIAVELGPVTSRAATFFAPRPLSARPGPGGAYVTSLWSSPAPVPVVDYVRGQGLAQQARPTSFTGVDLDVWGSQFLAQLDLVLSADYAVAAYRLDPDAYGRLVAAKGVLADAIRASVTPVTGADAVTPAELAAAKEALHQRVLTTLSEAYLVDTVVVLPVTVTAPPDWVGDTAPRLHGQPIGATASVPADGTLRSLAAQLGAPLPLLVDLLADAALLRPGAAVTGPGVAVGMPPYTVAPDDTLTTVAAHFAVTVADLGAALADSPGLLQPGAGVNLVVRSSTVAAEDTLSGVVTYLALDVATPEALAAAVDDFAAMNADVPGLFVAGTDLTVPDPVTVGPGDTVASLAAAHHLTPLELSTSIAARTDVLRAGATVAVPDPADPGAPPRVVTTVAADSLDRIAAVTGLGLDAVSAAVQDRTDVLRPGTVLAVPDPDLPAYTVRPDDTLALIAERVGRTVSPSWVASSVLHTPDVLAAGTVVRYLSRVPGFTLSDATVTLTDGGGAPSPMAFLLHTASNIAFSNLGLDLRFQVNQLEYAIADVPWAQGYQSSDWLTFLSPPAESAVGPTDVPIALRTFPVPPSVTGQRITAATARTTVRGVDTLHTVAAAVGVPAAAAAEDLLTAGAVLEVPTADRHRVRPGDTAADLAERHDLPQTAVRAAARRHGLGPLSMTTGSAAELTPGSVVPVPRWHTVEPGESLAAIADRHGVPVEHLLARNAHLPGVLQVGATVAAAGNSSAPTPQDLRRYDYAYTFSVRRAAQDAVVTGYSRNTPLEPTAAPAVASAAPVPDDGGLGGSLAQFVAVQEQLERDLGLVPGVDPSLPAATAAAVNPGAAAALRVFAQLAARIADDWARWVTPPAAMNADLAADPARLRRAPRHRTTCVSSCAAVRPRPVGRRCGCCRGDRSPTSSSTSRASGSPDTSPPTATPGRGSPRSSSPAPRRPCWRRRRHRPSASWPRAGPCRASTRSRSRCPTRT